MDYELGNQPPTWEYWQAIENGEQPPRKVVDSPIWEVLKKGLEGKE
jgi:hypothetical protein